PRLRVVRLPRLDLRLSAGRRRAGVSEPVALGMAADRLEAVAEVGEMALERRLTRVEGGRSALRKPALLLRLRDLVRQVGFEEVRARRDRREARSEADSDRRS